MELIENAPVFSAEDKAELLKALEIIREQGAKEIYLFGSMAFGECNPDSDWDFAVRGLPPERFLKTLGLLLRSLARETDLVDMDFQSDFARHLSGRGRLIRVG